MRVGTAAVAMVLVAEAAVWLLRPRERPIDPAPVSESDYFTPGPDRPRPRLQRRPAVALRSPPWAPRAPSWSRWRSAGRPRSVAASSGSARARCSGAAAAGAGAVGCPRRRRPAGARSPRTSARSTTASPPSHSGSWLARCRASRRRSAPCWPPRAGRAADRAGAPLRAALVAAGHGRGGGDRRGLRLAGARRARAALQQVHAAGRRQPGARPRCWRSRGAPAWTSGRCTAWTRAAGFARSTPTSTGSGPTRRVVLYDNLLAPREPPGAAQRSSPTSSAT